MPFGEIPSIHESPALAEVRAQQVFESEMREIVSDPEVFVALEQGIPERCLRYVVKVAQAVRNDGNAYRKATWNVRQWLTTTNGLYLDRYAPELQISLTEQRRHQEAVEELFMLLGDPGYARLLLIELEGRDLLRGMQSTDDGTSALDANDAPWDQVTPQPYRRFPGKNHAPEEVPIAQRPTVPMEQINLLEPAEAATRSPMQAPRVSQHLLDLLDEIYSFEGEKEADVGTNDVRDSGVRHVDQSKQVAPPPAGTRYAIPGKGQAEAIDFRLSDPWFE
jgi:hypothetical protein